MRNSKLLGIVIGAFLGMTANGATAQPAAFPGPVRIVVGFPAGGSSDVQARTIAEKLGPALGTQVVVENRAGAGGQIAAEHVRAATPDGTTVLLGSTHTLVMLPLVSRAVRYDPRKDFQAVGRIQSFTLAFAVPAASTAQTLGQWLDLARAAPLHSTYGVPASGSVPHFVGYQIGKSAEVDLLAVPYRGGAPLVQDLLGGQVSAGIIPVADIATHYADSKVRVLAVNGTTRSALLPQVPTLAELAKPGFEDLEWTGMFVPARTPRAVVERLNAALVQTLNDRDVRARMLKLGTELQPSTPEELSALVDQGFRHWGEVVQASGFKVD